MTGRDATEDAAGFERLLEENRRLVDCYKNSNLMRLVESKYMEERKHRERMLDCIQVFSNYFQKTIMLRGVFCESQKFSPVVQAHLNEEYGHNAQLMSDRNHRDPVWNPVLEATAAWFAWKMFTLDNEEKTVLVHLVLEASANVFFNAAHGVMRAYGDTNYFEVHAGVDSEHEKMGCDLLSGLSADKYAGLMVTQKQGWDVLNAACDQIAHLSIDS